MAHKNEKSFLQKLFKKLPAPEDGVTTQELVKLGIVLPKGGATARGLSFTDLTRAQQQRILKLRGQ